MALRRRSSAGATFEVVRYSSATAARMLSATTGGMD